MLKKIIAIKEAKAKAKRADRETRSAVIAKWPATDGLVPPYLMKQIEGNLNAEIVNEYLQEMDHEGLSRTYRSSAANWSARIAVMHNNKPYKEMTRSDILLFLGTLQKSEDIDPFHKWIGTYNYVRMHLMRFFRWLYNPCLPPPRPLPKVVENIPLKHRREQSIYKPDDLWTQEDAALFLKYSKSSRDSCYVSMALDTSARPHELLKLRIKEQVACTYRLYSIC